MREYLTTEDVCNHISMMRTVIDGAILVVEGITDSRLYGKFLDPTAKVVVAHSKDNVRGVVRVMNNDRYDDRVLGIMDADLDRLGNKRVRSPLFLTDCRDMEMMIIRSNALDDVLSEYCDQEQLDRFVDKSGPVRESLVEASYPIGLLMKISRDRGLRLSFKNLDFNAFINASTLELNSRSMVREVISNSNSSSLDEKELHAMLNDEARNLDDRWDAARGHDTIDILLIGLKRNFGSFNAKGLNEGQLGGALRLAFSDKDFQETELFTLTKAWADTAGVPLWDPR